MSSAMDEVVVATVDETLVEANIIDTDMSGAIVVAAGESAFRHFGPKKLTLLQEEALALLDSIISSQAMGLYSTLTSRKETCCIIITHFGDLFVRTSRHCSLKDNVARAHPKSAK